MIKRTLCFSNPCYLSKKQYQLIVDYDDDDSNRKQVPIEDIGIMVIENAQITFSSALMQALIDQNAAIIFTDHKHMPSGLLLPFAEHHAFTEKMYTQIEASQPLKKNLWQQTVVAKIRNQATLLETHGIDAENMQYWSRQVKSGDPNNLEGRAAAYYWNNIFIEIDHFRRARYGDAPNNLLNYGYAVLRAIVARSLVGSGLFPAIGIHHRNKYNPFGLADDVIEPYRPYVDQLVIEIMDEEPEIEELTPLIKQKLLGIATIDINIEKKSSPLMVGMQRTTASLMRCFEGKTRKILYPEFNI